MWFGPPECNTLRPRENRVVLLKSVCLSLPFRPPALTDLFFDPLEVASTRAIYSSRSGSYNETRGPIGGPGVVETLYSI
jgi:hypothetical protein